MRTGAVLVTIWLIIGVIASFQRGYFSDDQSTNCAELGSILLTIVVGPLNYVGLNPRISCELPQPSQ